MCTKRVLVFSLLRHARVVVGSASSFAIVPNAVTHLPSLVSLFCTARQRQTFDCCTPESGHAIFTHSIPVLAGIQVMLTYFRVLKRRPPPPALFPAVMEGLAKFVHLVNLDTVQDLLDLLKDLLTEVSAYGTPGGTLEACPGLTWHQQRP